LATIGLSRSSRSVAGWTLQYPNRFERHQEDEIQIFDFGLPQIDDAIPRISNIQKKAKDIKNSLAPINKLPPEILALVVTFLGPGRYLIYATAVCQRWRTALLSFPRLWSRIPFSSGQVQFETYLARSKCAPLEVQLRPPYFHLLKSLAPHAFRLVSLAVQVVASSDVRQIANYVRTTVPTIPKLSIIAVSSLTTLDIPSKRFPYVKTLRLEGISSFLAPHSFPHITELTWHVGSHNCSPIQLAELLDTLGRLPTLEKVYLNFQTNRYIMADPAPPIATLPHVYQMSLSCSEGENAGIPYILDFLELPNLTSLVIDTPPTLPWFSILPNISFGKHLPTLAELPEMGVYTCAGYGQVTFRGPSQASLEYHAHARPLGKLSYYRDRTVWGSLPLHSVRRLVVGMADFTEGVEDVWLVSLLRDLDSLEHLELEGQCGFVLRRLCQMMVQGDPLPDMKTLTVRSGAYGRRRALRLRDVADELGLGIIVTCHGLPPKYQCERVIRGRSVPPPLDTNTTEFP